MYTLEINFLKDRYLDEPSSQASQRQTQTRQLGKTAPLIVGGAVMLILPALVGGCLWMLNRQKDEIAKEIQDLDAQISQLQTQNQKIKDVEAKLQQVKAEVNALSGVFNQIKPLSAILHDIRDRVPTGVQISSIQQGESAPKPKSPAPQPKAPGPAPDAPPLPGTQLTIIGTARSFNDVNDFLRTLQESKFFNAEKTTLESAQLADNPIELKSSQTATSKNVTFELPQVVNYTIKTEVNNIPGSQFLGELARKGAVGLVTRIRTLEHKGAIQP